MNCLKYKTQSDYVRYLEKLSSKEIEKECVNVQLLRYEVEIVYNIKKSQIFLALIDKANKLLSKDNEEVKRELFLILKVAYQLSKEFKESINYLKHFEGNLKTNPNNKNVDNIVNILETYNELVTKERYIYKLEELRKLLHNLSIGMLHKFYNYNIGKDDSLFNNFDTAPIYVYGGVKLKDSDELDYKFIVDRFINTILGEVYFIEHYNNQ